MPLAELTRDQQGEILAGFRDHAKFCRESLTIRNEAGLSVPLELQPGQVKLTEAIAQQEKRGLPVRIRVLKARQVRMSVGVASHVWKRVAFWPGQQAKVYTHLFEATQNLYNYYGQFEESYKPFCGLKKLKPARTVTDHLIEYEGGGRITFGTAGTIEGGRSYSFKFLHLSENAFWPGGGTELRTGLLNSVPDLPDTLIVDESTANGMGGPFYEGWCACEDPANTTGWLGVFFGWWEEPKYSMPVADVAAFQRTLTDEEHTLMQRYGLKPQQIAWRRWCITNKCEGDQRRFQQEFPACAAEAFLTSGRSRFDMMALERMPIIREPLAGELEQVRVGTRHQQQFTPRADNRGALRVWKRPEQGHLYVIGADSAEGIDANEGKGREDPDYSVACVLDLQSGEQVAVLRERLEPTPFGEYLVDLARWYQWAYLVPESNSSGLALIEAILREQYPGHLIYQRRRDATDRRPPLLQELGWRTTSVTKVQLISMLDRALREMSVVVRDHWTLQELRTFVYAPNGNMGAQAGAHDDCVMALALAVVGLMYAPRERRDQAGPAEMTAARYYSRFSRSRARDDDD